MRKRGLTATTPVRRRGRPPRFPDRRLDVLRTAARVFSREGFRQATLSDIADALEMTRPALYYYARSKDELLAECRAIADPLLEGALTEARAQPTGLAQLQLYFVRYAEITCDDFGRCFVLTDFSEMSPEERERNRKSQLALGRAVADMVRKGMQDGSIRACDPVSVSRALFGMFNGLARWYVPTRGRPGPGEIAREYLTIIVDGLRNSSGR